MAARGARLQTARKARRLTQADLARAVDCDAMTISRVERGAVGLGRRLRRSLESRLALAEGALALPDEVEDDAPPVPIAIVPQPRDQSDRYGAALTNAKRHARRRGVSAEAIRIVAAGVMSEGGGKAIDAVHLTSMMAALDDAMRRSGHEKPNEENRQAAVPKMGSKRKNGT